MSTEFIPQGRHLSPVTIVPNEDGLPTIPIEAKGIDIGANYEAVSDTGWRTQFRLRIASQLGKTADTAGEDN